MDVSRGGGLRDERRARKGMLFRGDEKLVVLEGARTTLGRGPSPDVNLGGARISRLHAEIVFEGTHFVLRDLASTNGTTVNGIHERESRLTHGAEIDIGEHSIRFELTTGEEPDAFFSFVPTRRGVPAQSNERGRRAAVVVPEQRAPEPEPMMLASPMRAMPMPMPMGMAPPALGAPPPPPAAASVRRSMPAPRAMSPMPLASAPPQVITARQAAPHAPVRSLASEPYPEHELTWLRDRMAGALDLVFLVDATSSMAPYIEAVKARLHELALAVAAAPLCKSLRIGIVAYRDHPPQDQSFVTRLVPMTEDFDAVVEAIAALTAAGGGDGPEAVTDGLFDVVRLAWRPEAARAVVWFGDAPPHGVEPAGDGFPSGCPCGHHWFTQAESCREMGITFYCVGCLPGLREYVGAEQVFRTVARTTRGMFLPLREASLLVPLIASAAESVLDGQRLDVFVEALCIEHAAMLVLRQYRRHVRVTVEAVRLLELGLEVEPSTRAALLMERFLGYIAMTRAG